MIEQVFLAALANHYPLLRALHNAQGDVAKTAHRVAGCAREQQMHRIDPARVDPADLAGPALLGHQEGDELIARLRVDSVAPDRLQDLGNQGPLAAVRRIDKVLGRMKSISPAQLLIGRRLA
ncbi:hypothetical protein D3C84_896080 [compost metagenome]